MAARHTIRLPQNFDVSSVSGAQFHLGAHAGGSCWYLRASDTMLDFVGHNSLVVEFRDDLCMEDFDGWSVFGSEWAEELEKAREWFEENLADELEEEEELNRDLEELEKELSENIELLIEGAANCGFTISKECAEQIDQLLPEELSDLDSREWEMECYRSGMMISIRGEYVVYVDSKGIPARWPAK